MEEKNLQQIFDFGGKQTRVVMKNGTPWWEAADVCAILALRDPTEAIKPLNDDEKMTFIDSDSHSGQRGGAQMLMN